jgi:rhodanese-related sulfurtransferase
VVCIQPPVICMLKDDSLSGRLDFKESWSVKGFLAILLVLVLISNANAACSISGGCGGNSGDWESSANAFLNSDVPDSFISSNALKANVSSEISGDKTTSKKALNNTTAISIQPEAVNYVSPPNRSDDFANGEILKPLLGVSGSDIVIDAANDNNYSDRSHIKGAIHLPSKSFLYENGTLRTGSELAGILGNAGVSREDRAVIYGDRLASGDATFVFWAMRYLGTEDAKVLDGGLNDWNSASLPQESGPSIRNPTVYEPRIR